jgi:hypothetical protein
MQLPDDVLTIIREYSKPITRSNWRTLNPLCRHIFYNELYDILFQGSIRLKPLFKRVFNHLCNSQWGDIYNYIRVWGIHEASLHFKLSVQELYFMPAIKYAQEYYVAYSKVYHASFKTLFRTTLV